MSAGAYGEHLRRIALAVLASPSERATDHSESSRIVESYGCLARGNASHDA